jgi:uncharacterized protein YycO
MLGEQMITRRQTLITAAAALTTACETTRPGRGEQANILSADTLQSGDLIFPRRPGATVIYKSAAGIAGLSGERRAWEADKAKILAEGKVGDFTLTPSDQSRLRALSYESFLRDYSGPATADVFTDTMTTLRMTTGHVAIVVREGQEINVVEAVSAGVICQPYETFAKVHHADMLWHARLKGRTEQERSSFARLAATQTGKDYDIMSFDLLDDRTFYCSKLVWWSAWRSLGTALDENPDPIRRFLTWFSPKKLLNLRSVEKIVSPGRY